MWSKKSAPDESRLGASLPPEDAEPAAEGRTTRRSFLSRLGLGATLAALAAQGYAFLRSLYPNVLYEQPTRFKIGTPDGFGEGPSFLDDERIFIVRERNTFHVISAVCTHLGCTVKMERLNQPKMVKVGGREFQEQIEFRCPCHGSRYYGDGTNYEGPAPTPLECYKLEVSPDDGQLIVDASQAVDRDFRLTV